MLYDAYNRKLAPAPYADRFARVLGSTLTLQQVTTVLGLADQGFMYAQADLLDECRERDGHLQCETQKREARVAGAPWELVPPPGSGARGAEIARACTEWLTNIEATGDLARSFSDMLGDLQGGVFHGRAGHEVVWGFDAGYLVPRELLWIHPRRFAYATDWRLHLWDSSGTSSSVEHPQNTKSPFGAYPGIPVDVFPPGKFIVHRPRVRGVYPTREGVGRVCVWWSTFKRFAVRDLMAYAEWAGRGFRFGKYATGKGPLGPAAASDEDKRILDQLLDTLSSSTWASLPDTTGIDIKSAPNDNDVHDRIVALCNGEISKAIVGGTLGSEPGSRGARSLGEVHERSELMLAQGDARAIASTLRPFLRAMVAMNYGEGAPVPSVMLHVDPAESLACIAERLERATNIGVKVGQRAARNMLNLEDPEEDDELLPMNPKLQPQGAEPPDQSKPRAPELELPTSDDADEAA